MLHFILPYNPFTVKQNPLEKTDKRDAVWLATILMNGMAKPGLMVSEQQEAVRELTRQRLHYTQQLTRIKNRIIRILESCNYKIMSVVSGISTKTGMALQMFFFGPSISTLMIVPCVAHLYFRNQFQQFTGSKVHGF